MYHFRHVFDMQTYATFRAKRLLTTSSSQDNSPSSTSHGKHSFQSLSKLVAKNMFLLERFDQENVALLSALLCLLIPVKRYSGLAIQSLVYLRRNSSLPLGNEAAIHHSAVL